MRLSGTAPQAAGIMFLCLVLMAARTLGQTYGGRDSPVGDDVWVSCNPNGGSLGQAANPEATACVLDKHTAIYTHNPHKRDPNFAGSSGSTNGVPLGEGGIGTQEYPAASCTDLAKMAHFESGNYWLQPSQDVQPFQGYCDMEREGGGWLMCATTQHGWHISSETQAGGVPFGSDGYRSDCRNVPFNQVLYVAHPTRQPESGVMVPTEEETAWFSFNGNNALIASRSGWGGSVNSTWGAGLSTKFTGHGRATRLTPECVQERANSACRYPLIAPGKLQQCPDCFAVRPQAGNATCEPTASACWCDQLTQSGCTGGVQPPTSLTERHDAVDGYYVGWNIVITAGTGVGQVRKIKASSGGVCSSSSFATRSSCIQGGGSWTAGDNTVEPESKWTTPPCSNSILDGYRCEAECSEDNPEDGSTCNNEVVYSTSAGCMSACKGYDTYKRTYSVSTTGEDGATTTLTAGISASDLALLVDDSLVEKGIVAGKSLLIDSEIMLIKSVVSTLGNYVLLIRGQNGTVAASHSTGATVKVMVDFSVYPALPTCDFSCTTQYELHSPGECSAVDWACGHESEGGVARGYAVEYLDTSVCTGVCSCDNAGTAACSVGNVAGCACRPSVDINGLTRDSPWATTTFRLPAGADTDGCTGPFFLCTGFNPYAGYRLKIGSEERSIVAWSSNYKTLQVDRPFTTVPVPAPASDPTWASASSFELLYAPECTDLFDNSLEKSECKKTQEYELMICDDGGNPLAMSGGMIMTGVSPGGCSKVCEDVTFCEDRRTDWYRAETGLDAATGGAFAENGFGYAGVRKLSIGVRYVNNEYQGVNRI